MRQVNPNEAFKGEYHNIMLWYDTNNTRFFQWNIKNSRLFETSHATSITTKHIIKMISNMTC